MDSSGGDAIDALVLVASVFQTSRMIRSEKFYLLRSMILARNKSRTSMSQFGLCPLGRASGGSHCVRECLGIASAAR
jgi:hypothetical protein